MIKKCIDCKWSNKELGVYNLKCVAPQNDDIDYVEGNYKPRWDCCYTHRLHDWLGARVTNSCGKSGRWWEAKT